MKKLYSFFVVFFINILFINGQNFIETQKIKSADGEEGDRFGYSVDISDDFAIIGSYRDDDNGSDAGSAYIFNYDGDNYIQISKLLADDGGVEHLFGKSSGIFDDFAVIGAPFEDENGYGSGAAYVFTNQGTEWTQTQKLQPDDIEIYKYFGQSVAIDGDFLVVGADGDDTHGNFSGAAYVFKNNSGNWEQVAKLTASDGAESDHFGKDVSISGDFVAVGSYGDDSYKGSVYIFYNNEGTWEFSQKLTASDAASLDYFGCDVAIYGNYVVAGAFGQDDNGSESGVAYLFEYQTDTWVEIAKLIASDGEAYDDFGYSVDIYDSLIVVGADANAEHGYLTGAAYIYTTSAEGNTEEKQKISASDVQIEDYFGFPVAIDKNNILVSMVYDDDNGTNAGATYFFKTEVSELSEYSENFKIYPNPAKNYFIIESIEALSGYEIKIFDSKGIKILESEKITDIKFFDISDFQQGVYFIKIKNNLYQFDYKIIKE